MEKLNSTGFFKLPSSRKIVAEVSNPESTALLKGFEKVCIEASDYAARLTVGATTKTKRFDPDGKIRDFYVELLKLMLKGMGLTLESFNTGVDSVLKGRQTNSDTSLALVAKTAAEISPMIFSLVFLHPLCAFIMSSTDAYMDNQPKEFSSEEPLDKLLSKMVEDFDTGAYTSDALDKGFDERLGKLAKHLSTHVDPADWSILFRISKKDVGALIKQLYQECRAVLNHIKPHENEPHENGKETSWQTMRYITKNMHNPLRQSLAMKMDFVKKLRRYATPRDRVGSLEAIWNEYDPDDNDVDSPGSRSEKYRLKKQSIKDKPTDTTPRKGVKQASSTQAAQTQSTTSKRTNGAAKRTRTPQAPKQTTAARKHSNASPASSTQATQTQSTTSKRTTGAAQRTGTPEAPKQTTAARKPAETASTSRKRPRKTKSKEKEKKKKKKEQPKPQSRIERISGQPFLPEEYPELVHSVPPNSTEKEESLKRLRIAKLGSALRSTLKGQYGLVHLQKNELCYTCRYCGYVRVMKNKPHVVPHFKFLCLDGIYIVDDRHPTTLRSARDCSGLPDWRAHMNTHQKEDLQLMLPALYIGGGLKKSRDWQKKPPKEEPKEESTCADGSDEESDESD
ncbi:MAG: hypothetical protein SGILL_005155 [Bacillariaceae sp.]